jgi:hypothetical protein
MATHGTRRSVLRGLTGFAAGSLAAIGLGQAGRLARALQAADSEEQSVLLYEHMALIARSHVGTCAELGAKLTSFANDHADLFKALKAEQDAWPHAKRVEHADAYGDRVQAASTELLAARLRCSFVKSGTHPSGTPEASPVASLIGITPCQERASQTALPGSTLGFAAAQSCSDPVTLQCVSTYPGNSGFVGIAFAGTGTCDANNENCSPCISTDAATYCADRVRECSDDSAYPCTLSVQYDQVVAPSCCTQNCPITTADCAYNWGGGVGSGDDCLICMTSWCGSTDHCLENCESNDCCNSSCSDSYVPPPPAGP